VIVQVLVAQSKAEDALRQASPPAVLDRSVDRLSVKTGRQTIQQLDLAIHFAQQQRAAVARDLATGKPASTRREKMSCNENDSWIHSVMEKASGRVRKQHLDMLLCHTIEGLSTTLYTNLPRNTHQPS